MEQTQFNSDEMNSPNNSSNNLNHNNRASQPSQNVRHIPIYVEGRDEPIFNTHIKTRNSADSGHQTSPSSTNSDIPKSTSIFDRVKNFPVRLGQDNDLRRSSSRGPSPGRQVHVETQQQKQHHPQQQQHPQQQHQTKPNHPMQSNVEPNHPQNHPDETDGTPIIETSIDKIQRIQREVIDLMNKVEQFNGSRKDREYSYLDEMLTQNLLKLDDIDTEGNENIKHARRAAIKCINACIEVLETKAESGPTSSTPNQYKSEGNNIKSNSGQSNHSSATSTAV